MGCNECYKAQPQITPLISVNEEENKSNKADLSKINKLNIKTLIDQRILMNC